MSTVTLDESELGEARITASKLWSRWDSAGKRKEQAMRTLSGFYAEFAVVKYFNQVLGALPRVQFNVEYKNGGDGGFDFICAGVKFEVKAEKSDVIVIEQARATKADAIIGVRCTADATDFHRYDVFGFVPVSRLGQKGKTLRREDFLDLLSLAKARSDVFHGERPRASKCQDPQRVGDILIASLSMQQLKAGLSKVR